MLNTQCLPVLISIDVLIGQEYNAPMKIKKAFKFRLKPDERQKTLLHTFAGHVRFVWNKALEVNLNRLKNKHPIMYYQELDYWSKLWKRSEQYGFLHECPAHLIQQKLRDLDRAFKDCFDKNQPLKRMPKFKKRGVNDSFRFPAPNQIKLEYQHVTLPKLGRMRFYRSTQVIGDIRNYTISRHGEHWYICMQVEIEIQTASKNPNIVGIDLGVTNFVTTSHGEHTAPLNSFKNQCKKLAIAQRKLRKKNKFSQNWHKAKKRVTKIHRNIADSRKDFLQKTSTMICKNHAVIVVEDLKIKNMSKSPSGTIENPGSNVKAKSGLNKAILDQGWYEFVRQLKYKSYWQGGMVISVPAQYTSQRCSDCQYISAENRQTQDKFVCLKCRKQMHADVNAAKNILAAGHAVLACGASA